MVITVINSLILFCIGFFILIKGSNYLIDGSRSIAKLWKVSPWVIGVVIVGIGTSIPELAITLASSSLGTNVGLGTIIGSNIFNLLGIIGIAAIVHPLILEPTWVKKDLIHNLFAVVIAAVVLTAPLLGDTSFAGITTEEGFALLAIFLIWLFWTLKQKRVGQEEDRGADTFTISVSAIMIAGGLVGIFFGGKWVVDGTLEMAKLLGVSEGLIGLTIVGIGTSIPEFAVTLAAVLKRQTALAIGNLIGSNIFDFLGILGVAALVNPLIFSPVFSLDLLFAIFAPVALIFVAIFGTRGVITRWKGFILVMTYLLYLTTLVG